MKKLIFLILIELLFISTAYCSLVDTTTAKTVATNFFLSRASQSSQARVRSLVTKQIDLELAYQEFDYANNQTNTEPYYYIYNVTGENGFVIVTADDDVTPILGYAFEGKFDIDNQPPAFVEWMENYKNQIKYIKINKLIGVSNIKTQWAKNKIRSTLTNETASTELQPLLGSIAWDQGLYYNYLCPTDNQTSCSNGRITPNPDGHVYTGCTATAMGQLMRFWKWPTKGSGTHTNSDQTYSTPTINFGATTYDWSSMPEKVTYYKYEVAKILYHAGIAANSTYGACGTSASTDDARNALVDHFIFSSNATVLQKANYSYTEWINKIVDELNAGKPVLYRGEGTGGHIFICDGYQGTDFFHFNWGWNGNYNTYFYLNDLTPETSNFNQKQAAIIGLIPNAADLTPVGQSLSVTTVQAGSNITAYCAEDNAGPFAAGANVISIHLSADNELTPNANGDIYLNEINVGGVAAYSSGAVLSKTFQIPSSVPAGNYYVFFSADGGDAITEFNEINNKKSTLLTITNSSTLNPPRSLNASAGNTQVTLSWTAPLSGTPTSYRIYQSTSQYGSYSYVSSTTTSKTVTGLSNGNTYWFYITAVYSNGESAASNYTSSIPTGGTVTKPANDDCSNAVLLTSSTTYNYLYNQTVNNATASGKPKSSCDNFTGTAALADVWYYFKAVATSQTIIVDPNGSELDAVISVYSSINDSYNIVGGCSDVSGGTGVLSSLNLSGLTVGNYYYIRVYDYGQQTTNGGFNICVLGTPIQSITITAPNGGENLQVGTTQNITWNSTNITGTVQIQLYLNGTLQSVIASTSNTGSYSWTIPSNSTLATTYKIGISAMSGAVSDLSDNNFSISGETGLPDLKISYNSCTPSTISPGTLMYANLTRTNIGTLTAPAQKIGIYISTDNIFDSSSDQLLEESIRTSLTPGLSSTGNYSFQIPTCYLCGNYYIFFVIDNDKMVVESNESNNYESFQIQITGCTTCSFSIPSTGINFQSAGGSGNFNVTTTECCEWTANTSDIFITILNGSGVGNGVVNYTVAPSNLGGSRTGTITVAGQNHTITQNCVQTCNNSQSFEWAVKAGSSTLSDAANDLNMDNSGNLYMTGDIQGAASFGNGITLTTPSSAPDIFISKHNSLGQIQWAVQYGDLDQEYGTGIATDNSGNVYIIGNSMNGVTIGNTILAPNGTNEGIAFLIKLNSSGALQWAKKINSTMNGYANGIVIDKNNNIYIAGSLNDYSGGTGNSFYISKFNTSGTQIWYKTFGLGFFNKEAFGINVDNNGNLIVCGRYMQSLTLGTTTLSATSTLDTDGFISKFDSNCNFLWAKQLTSPGQGQDILRSVAVDLQNNIYTIGNVDSTAIVDNINIPLLKGSHLVLIKYDQNGNTIWAKASSEGQQYNQHRILFGNDNNLYFSGCFNGFLKLDNIKITGIGSNDNYLGCMDTNGKIKWLNGFGGILSEGIGGIVVNSNNDIFVSGSFYGTVPFGNTTLTSSGSEDIFLTKFRQCDPPIANISYSGSFTISPNESRSLSTEYCSSYAYQWQRNNEDIQGATLPSYKVTQEGTYNVIVKSFEGCETKSNPVILISSTSIPSVKVSQKLILFPNPTTGKFEISDIDVFENDCKIEIFNHLGSLIYSTEIKKTNSNKFNFDLNAFPIGLYLVKLSNNQAIYSSIVIKN